MHIVINSDSSKREAVEFINALPLGEYVVMIGVWDDMKSKAQRNLAHTWLHIIGKDTGNGLYGEKDIVKDRLPFAYEAGSGRIKLFVDWLIKHVPDLEPLRERIMAMPLKERSSESYSKKEYSEFLAAIEVRASEVSTNLPQPTKEQK